MERYLRYAEFVVFATVALIVLAAPALAQAGASQASKPRQPPNETTSAPATGKQGVMVRISERATYDDALKCFHFYAIAHETASKLAVLDKVAPQQKAALENEARLANFLQVRWQARITATKGDRTEEAVNADLRKIADPMLADANRALDGDKSARDRGMAQGKACAALEEASKFTQPAE